MDVMIVVLSQSEEEFFCIFICAQRCDSFRSYFLGNGNYQNGNEREEADCLLCNYE